MISRRLVPIAAVGVTALMIAAAVWAIVKSPGTIGEVGPYQPDTRTPGAAIQVTVQQGDSPQDIGERLETAAVIDSATQFRILVALLGYDRMLQSGDYEFGVATPAMEVIYRLRNGIVSSRLVTVIEGWRLEEIADAVAQQGVPRDEFLAAARSHDYAFDFVKDLDAGETLEGFLYPATYPIRAADKPRDIVQRMLQAFDDNVPAGIREAATEVGLSLRNVLTLAAIIEREAQVPEERPIMAQVFLRRLRLGMPLEADPTVQYGVVTPQSVAQYGYWKQELTQADLQSGSPYNTYRYYGLPPGPICNPGLSSIIAVVQPADTDYLYFVAKPDGSHAFARTLDEHIENVKKYGAGGGAAP